MLSRMNQTKKRPNPDKNKHQYSSSLNFFFFFFIHLLLVTDSFGKFQSVAFKVLHEQTGQFSDTIVPGIRLLTGSKVHTATAGTFTLGKSEGGQEGSAGPGATAAPVQLCRQGSAVQAQGA